MPKEILAWLDGNRNYADGLTLLRKYGASAFILELLSSGPSAFNTPKLSKELQKVKAPEPEVEPATDDHKFVMTAIQALSEKIEDLEYSVNDSLDASDSLSDKVGDLEQYLSDSRDASDQFKIAIGLSPVSDRHLEKTLRIKKQIKDLLKEIVYLRGQLAVLPEGDKLYQCSRDVLLKDIKKQELWQHLHYFEQHGQWFDELPENQVHEFDVNDPEQLEQKIKNLMASRSKVTKQLEKPWPKAKTEHLRRRQENFTAEINHYRSLRKTDGE